jgi:hypothetical protein
VGGWVVVRPESILEQNRELEPDTTVQEIKGVVVAGCNLSPDFTVRLKREKAPVIRYKCLCRNQSSIALKLKTNSHVPRYGENFILRGLEGKSKLKV